MKHFTCQLNRFFSGFPTAASVPCALRGRLSGAMPACAVPPASSASAPIVSRRRSKSRTLVVSQRPYHLQVDRAVRERLALKVCRRSSASSSSRIADVIASRRSSVCTNRLRMVIAAKVTSKEFRIVTTTAPARLSLPNRIHASATKNTARAPYRSNCPPFRRKTDGNAAARRSTALELLAIHSMNLDPDSIIVSILPSISLV